MKNVCVMRSTVFFCLFFMGFVCGMKLNDDGDKCKWSQHKNIQYKNGQYKSEGVAQFPKKNIAIKGRKRVNSVYALSMTAEMVERMRLEKQVRLKELHESFIQKRKKSYSEGCNYAARCTRANLIAQLMKKDKEILWLIRDKAELNDKIGSEKEKYENKISSEKEKIKDLTKAFQKESATFFQRDHENLIEIEFLRNENEQLCKRNDQLVLCNKNVNEYNEQLLKQVREYKAKRTG
jgi:hypothetical protein